MRACPMWCFNVKIQIRYGVVKAGDTEREISSIWRINGRFARAAEMTHVLVQVSMATAEADSKILVNWLEEYDAGGSRSCSKLNTKYG